MAKTVETRVEKLEERVAEALGTRELRFEVIEDPLGGPLVVLVGDSYTHSVIVRVLEDEEPAGATQSEGAVAAAPST